MINNTKVCVLDYGSGNVGSVCNVLKHLGYEFVISNQKSDIKNCSHLILPGVGAFGSAMKRIIKKIPLDCLEYTVLNAGKPFLGICVGMQVLSTEGHEFGKEIGLNWISGSVKEMDTGNLPLPHVGWNDIIIDKDHPIFGKLKDNRDFYFVHSYAFDVNESEHILAYTNYGSKFVSAVNKDNIYGVQFHPEKSQRAGQLILNNFMKQK